jgi:signal transduction histidine kinase
MATTAAVIAILAGLSLALSVGFLLVLVWASVRADLVGYYAVLLLGFGVWAAGVFSASRSLTGDAGQLLQWMLILEIGFLAASVALVALSSALARVFSARTRLGFLGLIGLLGVYGVLVQVGVLPAAFELSGDNVLVNQQSYVILLGPAMSVLALALLWTVRRRQRDVLWMIGAAVIALSQLIIISLASFRGFTFALAGGSLGLLALGLGLLEREIVRPAREQSSQVEALRTVTTAITSLRPLDLVLNDLARYTADLLTADMVCIFLAEGDTLTLRTVLGLPHIFLGRTLPPGTGMAGQSVLALRGLTVDDYAREWEGETTDLPFARDVFGAVLTEPLVYGGRAIGAVLAAIGKTGRVFDPQARAMLQLLAAQAAVVLQQNRLLSEQRALTDEVEAGRRQLESVLSSTESPVVALARTRRVLFANPSARELAASAGVDLETALTDGFPRELLPRSLLRMARELRREGSFTYDLSVAGRSFLCHVAPLGQHRVDGWVVVLNDVTELKELDRVKSDMMRMTSHDLKNPLQGAMANLELLRDDIYADGTAEVRESVDAVDQQLQRMYRIISGILDTERARSRLIALTTCSAERIIADVAEDMRLYAREREVALETWVAPNTPDVRCDLEQFERALGNLVENGLKYTPAGGQVRLSAQAKGAMVVFEVADTGVGIPPESQAHVFDRFFRGQQAGAETVEGTGIGLSLVKSVVENHRGSVWLESEVGMGTRFFVQVPAAHSMSS